MTNREVQQSVSIPRHFDNVQVFQMLKALFPNIQQPIMEIVMPCKDIRNEDRAGFVYISERVPQNVVKQLNLDFA